MKKSDIITQKKTQLVNLQRQSEGALDLITSTVNKLSSVNNEIDNTIAEIEEAKAELENTQQGLVATRERNAKVAAKFKAFLEV